MGVISDNNGALLFYTDGYSVWNKNHVPMPNGLELIPSDGATSTQASIIIPKPGSTSIYYIFTIDPLNGSASSGLFYSEVDMHLDGGLGDITTKGVKLVSQIIFGLSATLHENQNDVWVITMDPAFNYRIILITESGIASEITQQKFGSGLQYGYSQLKFSPDGTRVAVGYDDSITIGFSLLDFDNATGMLSNDRHVEAVRGDGLEFSSDGTKLYTGLTNVYQYDITLPTAAQIHESEKEVGSQMFNLYRHYQLGPDGRIYFTKGGGGGGTGHLGIIRNPNDPAEEVIIEENGLFLEGGDSFVNQTPNFIQNYFFKTDFTFNRNKLCIEKPIDFHITNDHLLDSVKWLFGEGSTSTERSPQFSYNIPGIYTITLIAYYGSTPAVITHNISVNPITSFDLGIDTTFCYGSTISVQDDFVSYVWNTGDTTRSIRVKQTGMFTLTGENKFGCLFKDSVLVTVEPLPIIPLPDTTDLGQNPSMVLDAGNFQSYSWNTGDDVQTITVDTEGWYSVFVKNEKGCAAAKSTYVQRSSFSTPDPAWILLNPTPWSATGSDAFFLDENRGFIVSSEGIVKTTDGGSTWEKQLNKPYLKRLVFANLIGYAIGDNGTIYKSTHYGDGWNKVNFISSENLNAISIINHDTLFVTSNNKVFKSYDRGVSWIQQTINSSGIDVEDSYFVSSQVGHIACRNGTIMKTENGGVTWRTTLSTNTFPSDFFRIKFVNPDIGFATREHSELFKTIDGGETWQNFSSFPDAGFALHFINDNIGFISGEHGAIHKTTDGGASWKWAGFVNARIWANDIHALFFVDENLGFAAGSRGRIIKTLNGGETWEEYAPTYLMIQNLAFSSTDVAYMHTGTTFFKSANRGYDWQEIQAPFQNAKSIQFINKETGYVTDSGILYKTTDGATTWGMVSNLAGSLNTINFISEDIGFAYGGSANAIMKTTNGGATWTVVLSGNTIGQIQFVSSQIGFARNIGNYYSRIFKTQDGGNTWQMVFEIDDDVTSFHFVDNSVGYLVGDPDVSYKTTDGGVTWQKINIPYEYYEDVKFYTPNAGFILDEEGAIFSTTDGGVNWKSELRSYSLRTLDIINTDVFAYGDFGKLYTSPIPSSGFINLDAIQILTLTDSTITIQSNIKSFRNLTSASLVIEIGSLPDAYEHSSEIDILSGLVDKEISYTFHKMSGNTTYYIRLKVIENGQEIVSNVISVKTPEAPVITAINPEHGKDKITVYPNPTDGVLHVISDEHALYFDILDILGTKITTGKLPDSGEINISSLSRGLYTLRLFSSKMQLQTVKIIKE